MRIAEKNYRPDIDGMRGCGAMLIVLCHLNKDHMLGGVGILTMFFVLSGFLITRNIAYALQVEKFSFKTFYARRIRRLFPAHITVLSLTMLVSYFILSPSDLSELGQSVVAVSLFAGNIFFSTVTGYFDSSAFDKPLLHTWSLSIEEQYYMVWPVVFVLLFSFRSHMLVITFLILGIIYGIWFSEWMIAQNPQSAYYLLPSRMYEFMLGSLMVWVVPYRIKSKIVLQILSALALCLIFIPIFSYSPGTSFPGLYAIPAALGACLQIYVGPLKLTGRVFNNEIFIAGGQISYALYLVHWPIIVLYKYFFVVDTFSRYEQIVVMVSSITLATLIFYLVETPLRTAPSGKSAPWVLKDKCLTIGALILTGLVACIGAHMFKTGGYPERVPREIRNILLQVQLTTEDTIYGTRKCHIGKVPHLRKYLETEKYDCLKIDSTRKNYLMLGDSTAAMMINGLKEIFPEINFLQATAGFCQPMVTLSGAVYHVKLWDGYDARCEEFMSYIYNDFLTTTSVAAIDKVIISSWVHKPAGWDKRLRSTIKFLKNNGHEPLIITVGPRFDNVSVPRTIYKMGSTRRADKVLRQNLYIDGPPQVNAITAELAEELGFDYIPTMDILCPEGRCVWFDNGASLFYDDVHFTNEGSIYFAEQIRKKYPQFAN